LCVALIAGAAYHFPNAAPHLEAEVIDNTELGRPATDQRLRMIRS
jgi:hypothetical protein